MRFLEFRQALAKFKVFSLSDIYKVDPRFYRVRLNEWQHQGYLQKITRGYYRFTDQPLTEKTLFTISNKIYLPSYISLESALSYYGLIPEGVYIITAVSSRKTTSFETLVGNFSYRSIKPELMFGYEVVVLDQDKFILATPEKSVLDYLYLHPEIKSIDDVASLRINSTVFLDEIDQDRWQQYLAVFNSQALSARADNLLAYLKGV